MLFIFLLIFVTVLAYFLVVILISDLNYPNLNLGDFKKRNIKNVLFVYPHPDDETMSAGGLITKMIKDKDFKVFVVDITKGDRGDELLKLPPEQLGKVREEEYFKAMKVLGASNSEIWDFPDGYVPDNQNDVKARIVEFIKIHDINLVVTFERWGIYGHKDHVTLSKVVSEIVAENKDLGVLYSTIGPKYAKMLNLKKYISGLDLADFESNELPEMKLPIYLQLLTQYRAVRNYKSQNLSHKYPLWVTILMSPYEYYTTKYSNSLLEEGGPKDQEVLN